MEPVQIIDGADGTGSLPPSRLRDRLRQLIDTLSEEGSRSAWVKTLQELRLYRRLVLTDISLVPVPPRRSVGSAVETRRLASSPEDLAAYGALRPDTPTAQVLRRLAAADDCFGAWLEGRLASAVWATRTCFAIDYLECEIVLREGDAYIYDSFTLPELRGRDLASWRTEAMKAHFRRTGIRRALAAHVPENQNQVRRADRRSHRSLATIGWLGIGPWRRLFVRPLAGSGLSAETLPALRWPSSSVR